MLLELHKQKYEKLFCKLTIALVMFQIKYYEGIDGKRKIPQQFVNAHYIYEYVT